MSYDLKCCLKIPENRRLLAAYYITIMEMIVVEKINLSQKFNLFSEHWSPEIIGELNGYSYELHVLSRNGAILRGKSAGQQFI